MGFLCFLRLNWACNNARFTSVKRHYPGIHFRYSTMSYVSLEPSLHHSSFLLWSNFTPYKKFSYANACNCLKHVCTYKVLSFFELTIRRLRQRNSSFAEGKDPWVIRWFSYIQMTSHRNIHFLPTPMKSLDTIVLSREKSPGL